MENNIPSSRHMDALQQMWIDHRSWFDKLSRKHMDFVSIEFVKQQVEWKDRYHSEPLNYSCMECDSMWQDVLKDSKTAEKQKVGFGERLSPAQNHQDRKCLSKHKSDMQKLKKLKLDDETVRQRGDTALHLAVRNNNYLLCCQLVEEGADVNHLNKKCMSPIMLAAKTGSEEVLSYLVKHPDARLDIGDQNKDTALHLAALNNHTACLRLLIKRKADLNIRNNKMKTALHIAVSQKYMDCVKILVERKAKVDLSDEYGNTPLHNAIHLQNIHKMKRMIAKVELEDMFRFTGDLQRGSDKPKDIAIYLAEHGASLDTLNNDDKSPLTLCQDKSFRKKLLKIRSESGTGRETPSLVPESALTGENIAQLQITIQNLQDEILCRICKENRANIAFNCGHRACDVCDINLHDCHMCRARIETRIRIY